MGVSGYKIAFICTHIVSVDETLLDLPIEQHLDVLGVLWPRSVPEDGAIQHGLQ